MPDIAFLLTGIGAFILFVLSALFLERTLDSIFGQGVQVEVFVMDAGSNDGTLGVIRRYQDRLAGWRSHPDAGQASHEPGRLDVQGYSAAGPVAFDVVDDAGGKCLDALPLLGELGQLHRLHEQLEIPQIAMAERVI